MSYIQLPIITRIDNIDKLISLRSIKGDMLRPVLNKTLFLYLNIIKAEIDNCPSEWDKYKKYTNPYEYIHTPVSGTSTSICKLTPLSRSYYKMVEICNLLSILKELPSTLKSFHLAEGPGGFIEALADMRKSDENKYHETDEYYGMSLVDDFDRTIPGWEKTEVLLSQCKNIRIEKGRDNKGDLTNPDNLQYCFDKYKNSMDLITGDGGFDFSIDFNQQERVSAKLIFCQVAFAVSMQKTGGTFIIKLFDTFTNISVSIIHLLTRLYKSVSFVKPYTSRHANSEKYLVCKNFRLHPVEVRPLVRKFLTIYRDENFDNMTSILDIPLPYLLNIKIEECNATCGQQQIECISNTLNLIDNNKSDKLEILKKSNIHKCKLWCQKHRLPYNKNVVANNIFLQKQYSLKLS